MDFAIHNPLGKPSGFLNRSIPTPLPQKVTAAQRKNIHSFLPRFFSFACLPTFCGRAPSARFVARKEFKFGRLLHIAMDFAAVIAPFPHKGAFPSVTTTFAGAHFPSRKICI